MKIYILFLGCAWVISYTLLYCVDKLVKSKSVPPSPIKVEVVASPERENVMVARVGC